MTRTIHDPAQLFPHPPRAAGLSAGQIGQVLGAIVALMAQVPRPGLDGRQRQVLAGYLPRCGPLLCRDVAQALRDHPGLFPDVPLDPNEIEDGSRRARLWLAARDALQVLAEAADEQYRLEEATAVKAALGVVRHVRADRLRTFPVPNQEARQLAFFEAEDTLAAERRR